jgi:hypothetical protein
MKTRTPANDLQARFQEIGLAEDLMVELQVTEYELPWDREAEQNRQRFLEQGYILVVDRRSSRSKTYFISPQRQTHSRMVEVASA